MNELSEKVESMGNPDMCISKHIFIGNGRYCEDCGHVAAADCHIQGTKISFSISGVIIEEKPEWTDITNQCKPVLLKSKQHDGYYTRLVYKGVTILVQGMNTVAPGEFLDLRRFKIEIAKGAKFSFRIYERTR